MYNLFFYTYNIDGDTFNIMVTVIGIEIGNLHSYSVSGCLHFIYAFGNGTNQSLLPTLQLWVKQYQKSYLRNNWFIATKHS